MNKFTTLSYLNLQDNVIDDISPIDNLSITDELLIGNNNIIDLSPLFFSLKANKINFINVFQNPLQYPPHDISIRGEIDIISWFEMIIKSTQELIEKNMREQLPVLDLGNMGLTDLLLVPQIFELTHLKELYLSNEWAML